MCREWFQNRDGRLPAYEWDFGDVNPLVQACAALEVFAIDGARDIDFLSRVFDKLLVNFAWWINREDASGSNLFQGGFLGLDNIGPIDRSHLPPGTTLKQSDATGWMAFYSLTMGTMAAVLQATGQRPGTDLVTKFLEHFAAIREAMESQGMWDDADGLFCDQLATPEGTVEALKVRSMVSIIPLLAKRFAPLFEREGLERETLAGARLIQGEPGKQRLLSSVVDPAKVERLLEKLFDEDEFLSPYGLRSLSFPRRRTPSTTSALCISHTSWCLLVSDHLCPFALWTAFPSSLVGRYSDD
jgi:Glycosyl hydrolase family 63 C-terminal domain